MHLQILASFIVLKLFPSILCRTFVEFKDHGIFDPLAASFRARLRRDAHRLRDSLAIWIPSEERERRRHEREARHQAEERDSDDEDADTDLAEEVMGPTQLLKVVQKLCPAVGNSRMTWKLTQLLKVVQKLVGS